MDNPLRVMISISEPVMVEANLEVKSSKYAVFYEGRTDSNWYNGINDKKTKIKTQNQGINVPPCKKLYKHLEKYISLTRY